MLRIDGQRVVDQGWYWPIADVAPSPQTVTLSSGWHSVEILYEQRIFYVASLQVTWDGPAFSKELIPLVAPEAIVRVLSEDGVTTLPWDGLVDESFVVEAIVPGDIFPETVTARVVTQQSERTTTFSLVYQGTQSDGLHRYLGTVPASSLIGQLNGESIASVIDVEDPFDYSVTEEFLDRLGVSNNQLLGIAWGDGDEALGRPPASVQFMRAAGFENAEVDLVEFTAEPDQFFLQHQADTLFYIGHGWHDRNTIVLENDATEARPEELGEGWNEGLDTIILFGCSVLDIGNVNGWNGQNNSPGIAWLEQAPEIGTWLGFQALAPLVEEDEGYKAIYALADNYSSGTEWVDAWKQATRIRLISPTRPWFRGAVGIENPHCNYSYWKPLIEEEDFSWYRWESVECSELARSGQGVDIYVASPIEIHIYDVQGRHVGPSFDGGYDLQIPGSKLESVEIFDENGVPHPAQRISIYAEDLSQLEEIFFEATADGTFDLFLFLPDRIEGTQYQVAYIDVPVSIGDVAFQEPDSSTGFQFWRQDGTVISPTFVKSGSMDLPVNIALAGEQSPYGWYVSNVSVSLSISNKQNMPQILELEYNLGQGWVTYTDPVVVVNNGEHTFSYRGVFSDGSLDAIQEVTFQIFQDNQSPIANAGENQTVTEGDQVVLSGVLSTDPDNDPLEFKWELIEYSGPIVELSSHIDVTPGFLALDDGVYHFRLDVSDPYGNVGTDDVVVTVLNAPPKIESVSSVVDPVKVSTAISLGAVFSDTGILDTHTAEVVWGDGLTGSGVIDEAEGSGQVQAFHTYSQSGIYSITLILEDDDGEIAEKIYDFIVVYDPNGGFVTAGGWFMSPLGSLEIDTEWTGKVTFGLNAKYNRDEDVPIGQTQLSFHGSDFEFHSIAYEWLIISSDMARYVGHGKLNSEGGYAFEVNAIDGSGNSSDGVDRIGLRIWRVADGELIFNTIPASPATDYLPIDKGSIVVHDGN